MFDIKGKLEFVYNNMRKQVEYSFCNLGGTPMFCFKDKNGYSHQFVKVYGTTWTSYCNKEPNWPEDFLLVLYAAFELEFQFIYNTHPELKGHIGGIPAKH